MAKEERAVNCRATAQPDSGGGVRVPVLIVTTPHKVAHTPMPRPVCLRSHAYLERGSGRCGCLRFTGSSSSQVSERNIANWADSQARECPSSGGRPRYFPTQILFWVCRRRVYSFMIIDFVVYVTLLQFDPAPTSSAPG